MLRAATDCTIDALIMSPMGGWSMPFQGYLMFGRYYDADPEAMRPIRELGQNAMFEKAPPEDYSFWEKMQWSQQRHELIENEVGIQRCQTVAHYFDTAHKWISTKVIDGINWLSGQDRKDIRPKSVLMDPISPKNFLKSPFTFFANSAEKIPSPVKPPFLEPTIPETTKMEL